MAAEAPHNPLSGLMHGLAVLSIVVMLAGQVIAAWAIWMSPDIIEKDHKRRIEESARPYSSMNWEQADKLRDQEIKDADENRGLGLKLYGGGFLAAIAFSMLANFTLPPMRERRTTPGTKTASVAVVLALMPIVIAVVAFAVLLHSARSSTASASGAPAAPLVDSGQNDQPTEETNKRQSAANSPESRSSEPTPNESQGLPLNGAARIVEKPGADWNAPWSVDEVRRKLKGGMSFSWKATEKSGALGGHTTFAKQKILEVTDLTLKRRTTLRDADGQFFDEVETLTWDEFVGSYTKILVGRTLSEERLTVAAGTFDCWVFTKSGTEPGGEVSASAWYSKEFPSVVVKSTYRTREYTNDIELTDAPLTDQGAAEAALRAIWDAGTVQEAQAARDRYSGTAYRGELDRALEERLAAIPVEIDAHLYESAKTAILRAATPGDARSARAMYDGETYRKELDRELVNRLTAILIEKDELSYKAALAAIAAANTIEEARSARGQYEGTAYKRELDRALDERLPAIEREADRRAYDKALTAIDAATTSEEAKAARGRYSGKVFKATLETALEKRLVAIDDGAATDTRQSMLSAPSLAEAKKIRAGYSGKAHAAELDSLLRHWYWLGAKQIRSFDRAGGQVRAVAFSPDARFALVGSKNNSVDLCETQTGQLVRTYKGHTGHVSSVAFSSDGKFFLTGGDDGSVISWEAASDKQLRTFTTNDVYGEHPGVNAVAISPNGKYVLAACNDKSAWLWETASGKFVRRFIGHTNQVSSVVFSADGRYALSGSWDRTARLWAVDTGEFVRSFTGHNGEIYSVALSKDGKTVLTGAGDGTARLWETATGKQLHSLAIGLERDRCIVTSVSFSPDGTFLLTLSGDHKLRIWETATGVEVCQVGKVEKKPRIAVFSLDGKYILTGGEWGDSALWGR